MSVVNTKRIAKNTVMLYIRMLLLMAVSLYTSRVILKYLGVDDYGIYTLIGGFITLFSIITGSLVSAVQRYFNVALGQNDEIQFRKIYSMSINIFVLFSGFILVLGETVGLWFVTNKLNIPSGRETAAMWVYQISLLTTIVQLLRVPDNASIIAYEKMDFYAYISIGEALTKLGIVLLLSISPVDKLITYVLLYLLAMLIINVIYRVYCNKKFNTCHYHFIWDKKLFKELLSFSGWSLINRFTMVGKTQAENYFLNNYHSVAVNAARGVAMQVYNAVNSFLTNFQKAFKPQLVKSYAAGEMNEHYVLVYRSAKFSFFLLLAIVIPVVFNMDALLNVWLVEVPPFTKEFSVYIMIAYLVDAICAPLQMSVFAHGNIKGLQVWSAIAFIIGTIVSFALLKSGFVPFVVSIVTLVIHVVMFLLALYYAHKLSKVSISEFLKNVMLPVAVVGIGSVVVPYFLMVYSVSFWSAVLLCFADIAWCGLLIWFCGLKKSEKKYLKESVLSKIHKQR